MNTITTCSNLLGVVPWSRIFGGEKIGTFRMAKKNTQNDQRGVVPFRCFFQKVNQITLSHCQGAVFAVCPALRRLKWLTTLQRTMLHQRPMQFKRQKETCGVLTGVWRNICRKSWTFSMVFRRFSRPNLEDSWQLGNLSTSRPWEKVVATHPMESRATLLLEITSQA